MPQNEHAEHPGKPVRPQHQVQPQRGQPLDFLAEHAPIDNLRKAERRLNGAKQGNQPGQGGLCVARVGR